MEKLKAPSNAKYELEIEGTEGNHIVFLSSIPRHILERALGLIMPMNGAPKMITAGEAILLGCWVGGDEVVKTDPDLFSEACLKCLELIERKNSTIKKL